MPTDRFGDALAHAGRLHRAQRRKGGDIPSVSHLPGVASLALDMGADEDQAIAALLHDAVEDQGGAPRLADIAARFGARVAGIVADCTDGEGEPRPPWRERKQASVAGLATEPPDSLPVSLADKTHDARAILADLRAHGDMVWRRFTGGRDGTLWYDRALADAFAARLPGPAAARLSALVDELERA